MQQVQCGSVCNTISEILDRNSGRREGLSAVGSTQQTIVDAQTQLIIVNRFTEAKTVLYTCSTCPRSVRRCKLTIFSCVIGLVSRLGVPPGCRLGSSKTSS